MRGLKSTIALVAILAGLGAYIYFVESKKPASDFAGGKPKDKVFAVESDKIDEITVTADNKETTQLKKTDGKWRIVQPIQADADETEVTSITTNIPTIDINRVVEENAADLKTYGLADPRMKIAFKGATGVAGELLIGDRTATTTDLYAMKPGEKRVVLIPSFLDTTFNKKTFDLREKKILTVKRDDIDLLEITTGSDTLQLARSGTEWRIKQPVDSRGDYSAIEGLLTRVADAKMTKLVEQAPAGGTLAPETLTKYGLDKPAATVVVGAGSSRATLAIGKEEEGATFARDTSRAMVFAIDPNIVTDLKKSADEYRNKNVFEFRPFNLARLRVVRGAETHEFQKVSGTGAQADKWQRVADGKTTDLDTAKADDFFSKLSNLRIQSFATAPPGTPELVVSASHDEGKFERVRFGKAGNDVLATRDGEPGAGKLDATNYGDMIKALDGLVSPPAPTSK